MIMNSDWDNDMTAENKFETKRYTEPVHHGRLNCWLIFVSGFNILITLFFGFFLNLIELNWYFFKNIYQANYTPIKRRWLLSNE